MTTLVPRSDIERLVQRRRHQTAHIARRVGDTVYLTPGLTDNQALHAIGNGVVPQQAIPAIRECLAALLPYLDAA